MLAYVLIGATLAFSAAVQPGPFQAYLVSSTMTSGWRRTMPAIFAPLLSDIPIVSLVLLLLTRVPPGWLDVLRLAGGSFLLYLAARAFEAYRRYPVDIEPGPGSEASGTATGPGGTSVGRRTVLEAAAVNLLNPNPYISWSTVLGPLVIRGWGEAPSRAIGLVAAFYVTMIAATALLVLLLAGARSLGPRVGRVLVAVSAAALAAFGAYQLWAGLLGAFS